MIQGAAHQFQALGQEDQEAHGVAVLLRDARPDPPDEVDVGHRLEHQDREVEHVALLVPEVEVFISDPAAGGVGAGKVVARQEPEVPHVGDLFFNAK